MWVKIGKFYHLNPTFYGIGWALEVSELDGVCMKVKYMKTARRKMLAIIKREGISLKLGKKVLKVRDILISTNSSAGALLDCGECVGIFKKKPFDYNGCITSVSVMTDRPRRGFVVNEDEKKETK